MTRLLKLLLCAAVFAAALLIGHHNAQASPCPPFCLMAGQLVKPAPPLVPWQPRRGAVIAE